MLITLTTEQISNIHRVADDCAIWTTSHLIQQRLLITFEDLAQWYQDGGCELATWLELLDISKWLPLTQNENIIFRLDLASNVALVITQNDSNFISDIASFTGLSSMEPHQLIQKLRKFTASTGQNNILTIRDFNRFVTALLSDDLV